jgi:hypothetical protein
MKSLRYLSAVLAISGMTVTSALAAGPGKSVVVTNGTQYTMSEFYASPSDSSGWNTNGNNNLIAGQSLSSGQSSTITIADNLPECIYDLMAVVYSPQQYAYTYEVDVCSGGSWNVTAGQ